jgi:hypothetical protein
MIKVNERVGEWEWGLVKKVVPTRSLEYHYNHYNIYSFPSACFKQKLSRKNTILPMLFNICYSIKTDNLRRKLIKNGFLESITDDLGRSKRRIYFNILLWVAIRIFLKS